MSYHLHANLIRILTVNGSTVGAAFLVGEDLVFTCAHVAVSAGSGPGQGITLVTSEGFQFTATVEKDTWRDETQEDIATIRITEPLTKIQPLSLGTSNASVGHSFSTYGFPHPNHALSGSGTITGYATLNGIQYLQLKSNEITPGFSGAPVFDEVSQRVAGMVVAIAPPDEYQRQGTTAFAVPTETLRAVCPELQLSERCPYRSLDSFTEADAELFFGRERVVAKLLESLKRVPRFLAVLGPSGSGKSSVVQAGLIPALRSGSISGSEKWGILSIRPGTQPFEQLASAGMSDPAAGLAASTSAWLEAHPQTKRLVILIDQFEELLVSTPADLRAEFTAALANLLNSSSEISIILTLRDDFYSRYTQDAEPLVAWLEMAQVNIPKTLEEDELREIIKRPACKIGLRFADGLVDTILVDARTADPSRRNIRSTILPLLEFALTQLWERREDGELTHKAYRTMGGVTGGLSQWADRAYYALDERQQSIARRIFSELVALGDETEGISDTRRVRNLENLTARDEDTSKDVIAALVTARLLVTRHDEGSGQDTVEIIHETLLREWGLLDQWIQDDRAFLLWHEGLRTAQKIWQESGFDSGALLRGTPLVEAEEWLKKRGDDLQYGEKEYITKSIALRKLGERNRRWLMVGLGLVAIIMTLLAVWGNSSATSAREQAATAQAASTLSVENASTAQAASTFAIAKEATATAALGSEAQARATAEAESIIRATAQTNAEEQKILALSGKLAAQALTLIDINYTQALLLGVESFRFLERNHLDQGSDPNILITLLQQAQTGLVRTQSYPPTGTVWKIAYSRNGNFMASASDNIDLWNTDDPLSPISLHSWDGSKHQGASDVCFHPINDTFLAASFWDGTVEIFNINQLETVTTIDHYYQADELTDTKIAFSPNGQILVIAGRAKMAIFDISTPNNPNLLYESDHPHNYKNITDLFFLPAYQNYLVSVGEDQIFRVWDLVDPSKPKAWRTIPRGYGTTGIAISPSRGYNFILASSQFLDFYDSSFQSLGSYPYTQDYPETIYSMVLNPTRDRLLTASNDGAIVEWDISKPPTARILNMYKGHTNRINSMAFHPKGRVIASGGLDSSIIIWDITEETTPAILHNKILYDKKITDVAFSQARDLLFVGDDGGILSNGKTSIWDISDPTKIPSPRILSIGHPVAQVAINPEDNLLAVLAEKYGNRDTSVYLKDTSRINYIEDLSLFLTNTIEVLAFGDQYAITGKRNDRGNLETFSWDLTNPYRPNGGVHRLETSTCAYKDTSFTHDGQLAAVATCTLQIWDFSVYPPVLLTELYPYNPQGLRFNPDGTVLASGNGDNSISLWNISVESGSTSGLNVTTSGIPKIKNAHFRPVTSVAFSPDGKTLASGSEDQTIILWDISDLYNPIKRATLKGHSAPILPGGIFFTEDGKTLISVSENEILLWDIDPQSWIDKACKIAGRNLNSLEWEQFMGEEYKDSDLLNTTCP